MADPISGTVTFLFTDIEGSTRRWEAEPDAIQVALRSVKTMLIRLLRTYPRPYTGQVAVVVALLVTQTAGNLYLPNLNADIINNGVVKGNLHYILRTSK